MDVVRSSTTQLRCVSDSASASELFASYYPRLVGYAKRKQAADPELVASHALHKGIEWAGSQDRLEEFTSQSSPVFEAYVYRCASNKVADEKRVRRFEHVPLEPHHEPIDDGRQFDVIDSMDIVEELLSHLTKAEREVMTYRFVEGIPARNVAERTGRSVAAVRRLQYHGLLRLRGLLGVIALALVVLLAQFLLDLNRESVRIEPVRQTPAEDVDSAPLQPERSSGSIDSLPPGRVFHVTPATDTEAAHQVSTVSSTTTTPTTATPTTAISTTATPAPATSTMATAAPATPTTSTSTSTTAASTTTTAAPTTTTETAPVVGLDSTFMSSLVDLLNQVNRQVADISDNVSVTGNNVDGADGVPGADG